MSRIVLVALLAVVLLAGLLFWMSTGRNASAPDSAAPSITDNATPRTHPTQAEPEPGVKPEPDNSFIVCPGNPRCP